MPKLSLEQLQNVDSFEDLAELMEIEEVVGILVRYEKGRMKMREANVKQRAIIRYAKEHPEQFKDAV